MDFSEKLLKEYKRKANKTLSSICRACMLLMFAVMILNLCGVFVIDSVIYPILIASSIIIFVPTIFYDIFEFEYEWTRLVVLTLLVCMSGFLYSMLSYHVIMMLVFPIFVSCLYTDRKSVMYTAILGVPVIIVAHIVAFMIKVVPDEPLVTWYGLIVYGILPRLLEYLSFVVIGLSITKRFQNLYKHLIDKNNEIYKDQQMLITSLTELLEVQSRETGTHLVRVAKYTEILCKALGMDKEETWKVSTASMMHDIGKIMIPNEILEKPGKLTNEEFEVVKTHVKYGYQMLEKSEGEVMQIAAIIAHEHHERFDGTGYLGILGSNINIYARCVALADVFDALVSRRCYKDPWSLEDAKIEILIQKGRQFDPHIVELFNEHYDEFVQVYKENKDM